MLQAVRNPQGIWLHFEYDALGRRTAKIANTKIYRYLWDGNVLLHEWFYESERRPKVVSDELGMLMLEQSEPIENLTTWVYEEGSLVPTAKLCEGKAYSIVSDYLGRPAQAYDDKGELIWQVEFDIYGRIREDIFNNKLFIPFRQLGQYEDVETGLYYNRFRYYDNNTGTYISQDPIGLAGNNPNLYAYVHDSNTMVDPLGLMPVFYHAGDIVGDIDPSKGRTRLDFNPANKGGFYVTTDLKQAEKWANRNNFPTITKFDVPDSEQAKLNIKNFDGATDEWTDFVTKGRQGKLAHDYDIVSGPMISNPGAAKRGAKPEPLGTQHAIFSDEAADVFNKNKVEKIKCK